MKIIKSITPKYKYAFTYEFNLEVLEFCRFIKTTYGYKVFGWSDRAWRFNDLKMVKILQDKFPEVSVDANMYEDMQLYEIENKAELIRLKKANELKNATDTDFKVNNINGELYPYQKIGVEFFINNKGKAVLADTMGLGKTAQALAFIAHTKQKKTIVICPASVKYAWEGEVKKWTKLKPFVIEAKTKATDKIINEHDIFIINYDIIKKFFDFFLNKRIDCAILDEFHYIKNSAAQRTKVTKALVQNIPSILLLSGTPLLSRPAELFNGLNLMDPSEWGDWYNFTRRYCNGHQGRFGYDFTGSSNEDELRQRISPYFLRREKEQVLTELPPKRFIDLPTSLDEKSQKQYNMVEANFIKYLKEIKKKKEKDIQKSMMAEKLVKLNELRQLTTKGKIYAAKDAINSIIDGGEKLVVFSVYNEPLNELYKEYKDKAVILTGSVGTKERNEAVKKFQEDDNIKLFFGGMKSAGVGITLTAAPNVLSIDFSWLPSDHAQSHDRIHRIGQEAEKITIYQLFSKGTIDEFMLGLLKDKQKIFDKIINKKEEPLENGQMSLMDGVADQQNSVVNGVIEYLENK